MKSPVGPVVIRIFSLKEIASYDHSHLPRVYILPDTLYVCILEISLHISVFQNILHTSNTNYRNLEKKTYPTPRLYGFDFFCLLLTQS